MKIAVSATSNDLDGDVDQRFGRCKFFLLIESENMDFNVIENKSIMASGGAGIKAAETIVNNGAEILITGNVGPNAFQTLSTGGIRIFTGASGSITESLEKYKNGELKETENANVGSHSGMRR